MTTFIFFYLLIIHFVGDFVLQTDTEAKGKSAGKSLFNGDLFSHVLTYSFFWFLMIIALTNSIQTGLLFTLITFVAHYLTDWCTSRIGKRFWSKNDYHNGFVVVGADQILHYAQLYFTFTLLGI